MDISTAPRVPNDNDEPQQCDVCAAENSFVLYDNDKLCSECGYAPDSQEDSFDFDGNSDPWLSWWEYRRANYSGWYGENRVKFVGGFESPW